MDARLCFVAAYLRDDVAMSLLCLRHGISRKTGYKWISRYRALGAAGLQDRSSAPLTVRHALPACVTAPILALRRARPSWGPRKLLARLSQDHPDMVWPAASTVGDLLTREGLVTPRRARRSGPLPGLDGTAGPQRQLVG
jgi:transposase-like protein